MKLFLTGGCGFIGSNLVRHLLANSEHSVVNFDKLTYAGNLESLQDLAASPRYEFIHADLADATAVEHAIEQTDPDAVIHLAAESHVDRSIDGPAPFIQTNVVGTFHLLESALRHYRRLPAARQDAFRFLHVSTDEVYGSLGDTGMFTESTRYDPHSPYAATKASSDHLARAWHRTFDLPVVVTNCSNNYGPYQFPEKLIPLMIIKCLSEESLPVYGKGDNVRDWLFVGDHARALSMAVEHGVPGETYNIGGNSERRNIDLVQTICQIMDELRPRQGGAAHAELITYVTDRPGHDYRYAIDSKKIQQELGWQPESNLSDGLRATVQWYLDNPSWWKRILDGTYRLERLGQNPA